MPVQLQTQIKETGPPYWLSLEPVADASAELRGQKADNPNKNLDEVSNLHPISLPLVHLHLSSDLLQEILPTTVGDSFLFLEKTVLLLPEFSSHCLQEVALLLTRGHTSLLSARLEQEVRQCLNALRFIDVDALRFTGRINNAGSEEVKLETITAKVEMVEIQLEISLDSEAGDISEPNKTAASMSELETDFQEPAIKCGTDETNKESFYVEKRCLPVATEVEKKRRCRKCGGCLMPDCGQCVFCRDMKKFGGRGRKKKACEKKRCDKLNEDDVRSNLDKESYDIIDYDNTNDLNGPGNISEDSATQAGLKSSPEYYPKGCYVKLRKLSKDLREMSLRLSELEANVIQSPSMPEFN